uniref:Uncharacterized protein n=1 Tax=Chromera velia CCMP2878 TaxID=1169474 RepID=A0A0G4I5B6_9ALVE|mmetsp:Transcript_45428/g.89497  ORF Transcript_45428/g.89497 Transcript_45428/m.89497 type:complete len:396 (-) Transcript_45428:462-1649(-)|eukprot:Cvel_1854.t1-p1 / transcript=Cvel_1854.t1 / gene=Cvel_1854 / organism=Chromera_velia_CCMP2878 / gene_product=hypothetical protein / transcript_product=hypothetical protein / location=Cvel_scaffold68:143291-144614(+) / protein_length=395 / sequence_SO=supercontig / SO=protein_coding / is_pseudo=false
MFFKVSALSVLALSCVDASGIQRLLRGSRTATATLSRPRGISSEQLKRRLTDAGVLMNDADNDGNVCFADGDNFDVGEKNTIGDGKVVNDENTDRGDWGKCLPLGSYQVLTTQQSINLYETLDRLHHRYCTHLSIEYSDLMVELLEAYLLQRQPFACASDDQECKDLVRLFRNTFNKALQNVTRGFNFRKMAPDAEVDCADSYTLLHVFLDANEKEGVFTEAVTYTPQPEDAFVDLTQFSMCGEVEGPNGNVQDEGGACIWTLDDVSVLPADQQNGFDNTDFIEGLEFPVMRSLIDPENEALGGTTFLRRSQKDDAIHCHYSPSNDGILRVHNYQHDLERKYPGKIQKTCFCNWRSLGELITKCDCTKDGSANNGCGDREERRLRRQAGVECGNC